MEIGNDLYIKYSIPSGDIRIDSRDGIGAGRVRRRRPDYRADPRADAGSPLNHGADGYAPASGNSSPHRNFGASGRGSGRADGCTHRCATAHQHARTDCRALSDSARHRGPNQSGLAP